MKLVASAAALLLVVACGGGGTVTPTTGGLRTTAPLASSPAAAATPAAPAPQPGGAAVTVVLTGGPDAGSYTASGDTGCSYGLIGPQGWGVQFSRVDNVGPNDLSSVQVVSAAPGMEEDSDATFSGTKLLTTVTIGPFLEETKRDYEIEVDVDEDDSSGSGEATVTDSGTSAVIHVTGTTEDGVGIDATVNCATVIRM